MTTTTTTTTVVSPRGFLQPTVTFLPVPSARCLIPNHTAPPLPKTNPPLTPPPTALRRLIPIVGVTPMTTRVPGGV